MVFRVSALLIEVWLAVGCQKDYPGTSLAQASGEFASAYCARVFACCEPAERDALFEDVTDLASCEDFVTRVFGNEFAHDTNRSEAEGRSRYDPIAVETCLEHLRADDCPHLARTFKLMTFPAECGPVRVPLVPVGGDCDHDFQCETGACANTGDAIGRCEDVPALGASCPTGDCGAEAFCDRSVDPAVCAPILPDGGACTSALGCESLECVGGACVSPTTCNGT